MNDAIIAEQNRLTDEDWQTVIKLIKSKTVFHKDLSDRMAEHLIEYPWKDELDNLVALDNKISTSVLLDK